MNWLRFIKELVTGRCCFKSRCDRCLRKDRIDERLEYIGSLRGGWNNGEGYSIPPHTVEWVRVVMYSMINNDSTQLPYIFPTINGGVLVEWCDMSTWPSVEFDNYFKPLRVHYIKDNDGVEVVLSMEAPIFQADELTSLLNRLSNVSGISPLPNNDISS